MEDDGSNAIYTGLWSTSPIDGRAVLANAVLTGDAVECSREEYEEVVAGVRRRWRQ